MAFGVGTAVLTGYGVASADSTSSGGESSSSSQGSSGAADSSGSPQSASVSGGADETNGVDDADGSGDSGASGDSEAATEDAAADDAAAEDAADEDAAAEDAADEAAAVAATDLSDDAAALDSVDFVDEEDALDPSGSAGSQSSETDDTAIEAVVEVQSQAVETGVDPSAGDGPTAPPVNPPLDLAMAAAARQDSLGGIFGNPITVDPTIGFPDGAIVGDLGAESSSGNSLIYTVTDGPAFGKAFVNPTPANPLNDPYAAMVAGMFTYLPDYSLLTSRGTDEFTVMVSELSDFMMLLKEIPLLGDFVQPIVLGLQRTPILGDLLQPIIGYRVFSTIDVNIAELVPVGAPAAFTTMVTSFDDVRISTNFFPAAGLMEGDTATTVLNGPGLGASGNIDANSVWTIAGLTPGIQSIREAGYNYVSWDPRGEHASGGFLQLDNPFFEGRDVQHIIDYLATLPETQLDGVGDPTIGMIGGSYGGGIQLVTAGIDDRIEAIVPGIAWNSLNESLYPTADFKTAWAAVLGLALLETGAHINSQIYPALIQGSLLGFLNESQQALLSSSGPTVLVNSITAPTLLIQGTVDGLFPLEQSTINAGLLEANDIPVDVIWYCGGHGVCLDPQKPALGSQPGVYTLQGELNMESTLNWLDKYVNGNELVPTGPRFEWFDQNGDYHASELLPTDPAFYGDPFVTPGAGGSLLLQPLCCGGSGPQTRPPTPSLVAPALAAPARDAINIPIPGPLLPTQMVGAPELSFTYSGLGTSRHIYAQLVDDQTNLVLGNIITAVPVDLDGGTHEVTMDLQSIAYTMTLSDSLTLQIVGATSVYADATQWGFINVSNVEIALPTVAAMQAEGAGPADAIVAA